MVDLHCEGINGAVRAGDTATTEDEGGGGVAGVDRSGDTAATGRAVGDSTVWGHRGRGGDRGIWCSTEVLATAISTSSEGVGK